MPQTPEVSPSQPTVEHTVGAGAEQSIRSLYKSAPKDEPETPQGDAPATQDDTEETEKVVSEEVVEEAVTEDVSEDTTEEDAPVIEEVEEDEEERDSYFLEAETSRYRTRDDAIRGIKEKDRYIDELQSSLQEVGEYESIARQYQELLPQEELDNLLIRNHMPEDLRDIKEDDIEDADQLRRYAHAVERARFEVEKEKEKARTETQSQREKEQEAYKRSVEFVSNQLVEENFFDVHNREEKYMLGKFLDNRASPSSPNYMEVIQNLAQSVGENHARMYMEGLKRTFWSDRRQTVEKTIRPTAERVVPKPVADPPKHEVAERKAQKELEKPVGARIQNMYQQNSKKLRDRRRTGVSPGRR